MGKKVVIDADDVTVKEVKKEPIKENYLKNSKIVEWLIYMFGYTIVLLVVSLLFPHFEVRNIIFAFLGAVIISILNKLVKPILNVITLPITIVSCGLFYEITNIIILYLTMAILGKENFYIGGFLAPWFIALFISLLNILVEKILIIPLNEKRKRK